MKPALATKIDYNDTAGLLILRNLLNGLRWPKFPAYMAHPPFSRAYERQGFVTKLRCARKRTDKLACFKFEKKRGLGLLVVSPVQKADLPGTCEFEVFAFVRSNYRPTCASVDQD
jgi:hypothetical protein